MTRDPKVEPRFGDIFRWSRAQAGVMFLTGNRDNWTGLDLDRGGITEGYAGLDMEIPPNGQWLVVERALTWIGVGPAGPFVARYAIHHINGDPTDNRPENLIEFPE